jgi:hypothetical protein
MAFRRMSLIINPMVDEAIESYLDRHDSAVTDSGSYCMEHEEALSNFAAEEVPDDLTSSNIFSEDDSPVPDRFTFR